MDKETVDLLKVQQGAEEWLQKELERYTSDMAEQLDAELVKEAERLNQ